MASSLEERIEGLARRFDLPALVAALERAGYGPAEVRFRGNSDPSPPRGVVESVQFDRNPRRALVTVNLGLNGHRGYLPAYFEQVAESLPEPERLHRFIEFFEDGLLRDYVYATTCELHPRWRSLVRAQFSMLGLGSCATLTWLFQALFPELGIRVVRSPLRQSTDAHALITGTSRLDGSGVLGSSHDAGRSGFSVGLYTSDEYTSSGRTWWSVATERLERHIAPRLEGLEILLEVVLVVADHASWARVAPDSQLGYDRLVGASGRHQVWVRRDGAFRFDRSNPSSLGRNPKETSWNTPRI